MERSEGLAAAGAGVILTVVAFWLTPLQGRADFLVVAYLAGVAAYLLAAVRTEGRRAVVDRLAAVLMVTTVGICLLALGSVLVYTAARGDQGPRLVLLHPFHERRGPP